MCKMNASNSSDKMTGFSEKKCGFLTGTGNRSGVVLDVFVLGWEFVKLAMNRINLCCSLSTKMHCEGTCYACLPINLGIYGNAENNFSGC